MATLVVNTGLAIITNRIIGSGTEPYYGGWGTGAGTTAATDTTLFTEVETPRIAGTASQQTTTTTNDTYQVIVTRTAASIETITNFGLFDAATSGNLFFKSDFTGVALAIGDSIQFTAQVSF
jgi:hypothetical protein